MDEFEQISLDFNARQKALTVSQLTGLIKTTIEENIGSVWVEGEVSNYHKAASGHSYFTLKDDESQVQVVMFRNAARYVKFKPENGLTVMARGIVSVYPSRGQYQVIAEYLEPTGLGALELALKQLKEKLAKEGLFDEERKRPIPKFPVKIGLVTSDRGAAIRDMLRILHHRWPVANVLISPTRVQGNGAADEIAAALDLLNSPSNPKGEMDVIIVGRGGGSIEDLWAFNEEAVARAIARSTAPVVSAVGHEVDFTISDLVADLRAPTPTAAAQMVTPDIEEVSDGLKGIGAKFARYMHDIVDDYKSDIEYSRRLLKDPRTRLREIAQRADDLGGRLNAEMVSLLKSLRQMFEIERVGLKSHEPAGMIREHRANLSRKGDILSSIIKARIKEIRAGMELKASKLDALSPLKILDRGYSITETSDGNIIKAAATVSAGDEIQTRLASGIVTSEVKKTSG